MKVSDLKLKAVYIGSGGAERLLVDRSQDSAVITQKDSDLVEYRVVENGVVSNQKCIITTRAFARWAVTEKVHKVTITTGNIFYLGNEKVVVSFVYSIRRRKFSYSSKGKGQRMIGRHYIYGIDYVSGPFSEVVDFIEEAHNDKSAVLIGFAPMTSAANAVRNKEYRNILNSFDIVCMDGASIVRKVKDARFWRAERCSGPDVMQEIMRRTAYSNTRHFLYGTNQLVLEKLRNKLTSNGANIVGTMAPPYLSLKEWYDRNWRDEEFYKAVRECKADYVWVALGAPKQEYFCMAAKNELPGVKLCAVGAAFNFLSGEVARAPDSWQKAGLEWLWRIIHEPKQIGRYVSSGLICFAEPIFKTVRKE